MSKEIKLGVLAIAALGIALWGFKFLKGQNIFSKSSVINTTFNDVTGLDVSAPVYINGYQVGDVTSITMNPDDLREMIVAMRIEGEYAIPSNAKAVMRSDGLVSGNAIDLKFDKLCTGADCLKDQDFIKSQTLGLLGSMLTEEEMEDVSGQLGATARTVIEDLGKEGSNASADVAVRELSKTLENMTEMTRRSNDLMRRSAGSIEKTMASMASITENLAASNAQITSMLNNMNSFSAKMANSDIDKLSSSANKTMTEAEVAVKKLSATLEVATASFTQLSATLKEVNEGDGSMTKLLKDKKLYDNLASTSGNLALLLQDLRLNPGRYVKVSVFGGKDKSEYVYPEDDPAFKRDKNKE